MEGGDSFSNVVSVQDSIQASDTQMTVLGSLFNSDVYLSARSRHHQDASDKTSKERLAIMLRIFSFWIISWAFEVRTQLDQLGSFIGVFALFLLSYFLTIYIRWNLDQIVQRPTFERWNLVEFVQVVLSWAVDFFGFIFLRLAVDYATQNSQFDQQSILLKFVSPTVIFMLIYLDYTWCTYHETGPSNQWRSQLD